MSDAAETETEQETVESLSAELFDTLGVDGSDVGRREHFDDKLTRLRESRRAAEHHALYSQLVAEAESPEDLQAIEDAAHDADEATADDPANAFQSAKARDIFARLRAAHADPTELAVDATFGKARNLVDLQLLYERAMRAERRRGPVVHRSDESTFGSIAPASYDNSGRADLLTRLFNKHLARLTDQ